MKEWREETFLRGTLNRLFQFLARILPGAGSVRVKLHRARGVNIGRNVFISEDVILETGAPNLITIEDRVFLGVRTTIIAHFRELNEGVKIESDVFVGPGAIILPNVILGRGSVVAAGSVVTRSVPPMTLVQGNPAAREEKWGAPLGKEVPGGDFPRHLNPLAVRAAGPKPPPK